MSKSVLFWYFRISRRATVPGLNLCGFFTPPVAGADFRAAFVVSCLRESLPELSLFFWKLRLPQLFDSHNNKFFSSHDSPRHHARLPLRTLWPLLWLRRSSTIAASSSQHNAQHTLNLTSLRAAQCSASNSH